MSPQVRSALTIENALLGFFYVKPAYGYEIYQEIKEKKGLGLVWHLKQSRLYALLDRLEGEGFLKGRVEIQNNRPAKILFSLTDTGRQVFCSWMVEPVRSAREMRLEFMAKAYFVQKVSRDQWQGLLLKQTEVCESWLDSLKQQEAATRKQDLFSQQVLHYRIEQVKATLSWIEAYKTDEPSDQVHMERI